MDYKTLAEDLTRAQVEECQLPQEPATASEICEETRGRWATTEELIEMGRKDAEDHHAKGYPACSISNVVYDAAYRGRRAELDAPTTRRSVISADDLAMRLLELPTEIERDEMRLADARNMVAMARFNLQRMEDDLLTTSAALIDGRNESVRAAQIRQHTIDQRRRLQDVEENLRGAEVMYHRSVNEFSALRSVVKLLEGG